MTQKKKQNPDKNNGKKVPRVYGLPAASRISAARDLDAEYPPIPGTPGAVQGPTRFRAKAEKDPKFDVRQAKRTLRKTRGR